MLIACLGWGSLVWDPRELPVRGEWFADGPFLPIEFARQSSDWRITLVIMPKHFPSVRSLWKPLEVANIREAWKALGKREGSGKGRPCVDYWPRGTDNKLAREHIGKWAKGLQIDGVVWTNLPPKFNGEDERIPTSAEVVTYLQGLQEETREKAKEYIQKTPRQIDTNYRRAIERELGWGPLVEKVRYEKVGPASRVAN